MMRVGIIQSSFMPWRGYFDLIDDVDIFVFYDDVQFTRRDWRNRNRFKTARGSVWVTVPVQYADQNATIDKVKIDYSQPWVSKWFRLLEHNYSKTRFGRHYISELAAVMEKRPEYLTELNILLIRWVMGVLNIETETILSNQLEVEGSKTERLLSIVEQVGGTHYLSGPSAKNYIDSSLFSNSDVGLAYKSYDYAYYEQLFPPFDGFVSVFDMLCSRGENARELLKSCSPNEVIIP